MSKIHTALKESAGSARTSPASPEGVFSSLDEKLIAAGVAPEALAEAHTQRETTAPDSLASSSGKRPSGKPLY